MTTMLMRAIKRELGEWATDPVTKVGGAVIGFLLIMAVLWLTKELIEIGSIADALLLFKSWLMGHATHS